jgi:hypothetical protein
MSIIKNTPHYLKHSKKAFTTIQNSTIETIKDPATLGVYVYLASKHDNWEISETNLQNRFGKGRDFIRARIADLKKIGLMESVCFRNEKGLITHWETVLYNEVHNTEKPPSGKSYIQNPENPVSGENRHLVDPPTTNKRSLQKKDIYKPPMVPHKKKPSFSISKMQETNPHQIQAELLQEWIDNRKKPMTERVWNKTNKVMSEIKTKTGIEPLVLFERMLEKQWQGMEVNYFDDLINPNYKLQHKSKNQAFSNVIFGNNAGGEIYDEQGNIYESFN